MATHQNTLDSYGIDPFDSMSRFPFDMEISASTYGAYWEFRARPVAQSIYDMVVFSGYDYAVFTGNAPDVFGAYVPFGFQSQYVWLIADFDVDIDYTVNNINPYVVHKAMRHHLLTFSGYGFRIRNTVAGTNARYQLVVYK